MKTFRKLFVAVLMLMSTAAVVAQGAMQMPPIPVDPDVPIRTSG